MAKGVPPPVRSDHLTARCQTCGARLVPGPVESDDPEIMWVNPEAEAQSWEVCPAPSTYYHIPTHIVVSYLPDLKKPDDLRAWLEA